MWLGKLGPIGTFTAVLMVIGGFQAWSFVQSERAFVFPTTADFVLKLTPDTSQLLMYIDVKNSGKSPATIFELRAAVTHILEPTPTYGANAVRVAFAPVVGSGEIRQRLNFGGSGGPITNTAVIEGRMKYYIYGRFTYTDRFSKLDFFGPMESQFCFEYIPGGALGAEATFRNCRELAYTYTR